VKTLLAALRGLLHWLFTWLVVLVILFEEWGWEPLARLAARLGELPLFGWLERKAAGLSPYAALVAFGVPALALLPVKLLALYAIGRGWPWLGLSVVVLAKLLGTAVVARLYQLTRPALLSLPWFARWHTRWVTWKRAVVTEVRASAAWRASRRLIRRSRLRIAAWWQRFARH
jgi:hypothetical protein